ncbi:MAG: hypothetical protein ABR538_06390 [Candidatus Binatia bacterium]
MNPFLRLLTATCSVLVLLATAIDAQAALEAGDTKWDGSEPAPGVYFHWYEPSFYAGFAPRTQDPARVHIELARGNQVRVTMVLGDAEFDNYLGDLDSRRRLYQELIDAKVMELTTNREFERFVAALDKHGVAAIVSGRSGTESAAWHNKALDVMTALNPGRVFRIRMPLATVAPAWHARLLAMDEAQATARLDAANAVLPGRVNLTELPSAVDAALSRAVAAARSGAADSAAFRGETETFVAAATSGRYRVAGGAVEAVEFTTIYPAGTLDTSTTYKGERLPDFGVTGVWPLIKRAQGRGRVGMVDYLSTNPGYGFIPILGYQHAGGISYNAFHNAGVRAELGRTGFLPPEWRRSTSERDGKPMQNLWMVSRGLASHGCTRLPSGHMNELRHILPTEEDAMIKVKTFRNLPQCYDVFDLRGDGKEAAMGVQYYIAYKSNEHIPSKAYAPNNREGFYRWLYGANVEMAPVGSARLKEVPVCRFVGRKAQEAQLRRDVPLHEADFAPEALQFYKLKPVSFESAGGFEFNREIRKVGAGHTIDRKRLFLK